jgi:lysophospholipase L1-like esterase
MTDSALNIVFLGDSQFDNARDTGTSIPELVGQMTGASVYNLGCGGTSASLSREQKNISWDEWSSPNFTGVVWALAGSVSPKIFDGYAAANVFPNVTPSKVDYYVVEYGVNDYFNGTQIFNQDDPNDKSTYVTSLRIGIDNLRKISPKAKIILSSPAYALFYNTQGVYIGDGNVVDKGAGTLSKYASSANNVANDKGCLYLDAYYGTVFDLNGYTTDAFLQDGVHFTEKGRRVYATALSHIINKDLGKDKSDPGVLQIENF